MGEKNAWELIAQVPKELRAELIQFVIAAENPREWPLLDEKTIRNTALSIMRRLTLSSVDGDRLIELGETVEQAKTQLINKLKEREA